MILKSLGILIFVQIEDHDHFAAHEIPLHDTYKALLGHTVTAIASSWSKVAFLWHFFLGQKKIH